MKMLLELQAIQSIGNTQSNVQSVSGEPSVFTGLLEEMMTPSTSSLTDPENLLGYYGNLNSNTTTNSIDNNYLSSFVYNSETLPTSYYTDLTQNEESVFSNYINKDYLNTAGFTNVLAGANAYSDIIEQASQKYGVPGKLIAAVMKQESNYDEHAVSSAGATGLMQLMPGTAKYLGVQDPKDPVQNIMGGTKYLGQMLEKFDQNIELALAAYNAGPGNVSKYGGIPPFTETKNYVNKILNYYNA
ncbi:lytic transglycosylase domain-containing protein [Ureibacillus aquaedulcis]|uniref:Lytic transglycosylase domain-containing protein n=1 Tax=Ureibacillus aquaedulcis TaxID=3058421 RepID=A0ABT8GM38_9BACL|nr:lytic transglycosylase domain-containing protein [Ureibacillus sp. BA0131]MDN4492299.1 lytic transglycosylase domain-containing protein [Ureibacillus sp. BA0131]